MMGDLAYTDDGSGWHTTTSGSDARNHHLRRQQPADNTAQEEGRVGYFSNFSLPRYFGPRNWPRIE